MKVLGFHFSGDTCCNSLGELCHDGFLDFLHRTRPDCLNVFYNLDWAVALLCHGQLPAQLVDGFAHPHGSEQFSSQRFGRNPNRDGGWHVAWQPGHE